MFKEPRVTVALSLNDGRTTMVVHGGTEPTWIRWDLREIERAGHHALCQRLGSAALSMLIKAHPAEFAKFPLLLPEKPSPLDDLIELVCDLIHLTTVEQTTAYVEAIDRLITRPELAQTDLPENWREIRIRVMSRPAPT